MIVKEFRELVRDRRITRTSAGSYALDTPP
jgi:hypothetical protein